MERAAAREQIWTPDKGEPAEDEPAAEKEPKAGELWTPGS